MESPTTNPRTNAISLGDPDRDGDLAVVSGDGTNLAYVYYDDGDGNLAADPEGATALGTADAFSTALGDVEKGGVLDLVIAGYIESDFRPVAFLGVRTGGVLESRSKSLNSRFTRRSEI